MSAWLRRYVFEEVEAGEVAATHLLECGHRRRPLFTPMGSPRRWQYCPDCYRGRARPPAPPVSIIRCSPDDAHWLAGLLCALVHRGELEHPDRAQRIAVAAAIAYANPINPTQEATHG